MAYSDYGAYVWKNGIDITKSVADKNYFYFKNEKNGMIIMLYQMIWILKKKFMLEDMRFYC